MMNGMNRTDIQLSFDTTSISVSLMAEWVFLALKRKFDSGDQLIAGFEFHSHRRFSRERDNNFSHNDVTTAHAL